MPCECSHAGAGHADAAVQSCRSGQVQPCSAEQGDRSLEFALTDAEKRDVHSLTLTLLQ